jgi:cytoplasmic tRNA 2-thiolation protein 1
MESTRPQAILDIIYSAECIKINDKKKPVNKQKCDKCGFMTSNRVCKACLLLEGLNKNRPKNQIELT